MARHEVVGDVRGKGLMVAVELVADRKTKKPIDKKLIGQVFEEAYRSGVMVRVSGNTIILSPPLVITTTDAATIVAAIDTGLASIG